MEKGKATDDAYEQLTKTAEFWNMRRALKHGLLQGGNNVDDDLQGVVLQKMESQGFGQMVRNFGFSWAHSSHLQQECSTGGGSSAQKQGEAPQLHGKDSVVVEMERAQALWNDLLLDRLNHLREGAGMPLVRRPRPLEELRRLRNEAARDTAAERIGEVESPFTNPRVSLINNFLYTADDLYHALVTIGQSEKPQVKLPINELRVLPPDFAVSAVTSEPPESAAPSSGGGDTTKPAVEFVDEKVQQPLGETMVKRMIDVPSLKALRDILKELSPQERHLGVDDLVCSWFSDQHLQRSREIVLDGCVPDCWTLARHGLPNASRPKIWKLALGFGDVVERDKQHFDALCEMVESQELLTDLLVERDIQLLANSQHFFPFEETLRSVLLAFTRDSSVTCSMGTEVVTGTGDNAKYPPSGVLPFKGLVMYAAPVCYLCKDPADVYRVFKSMFCRFWCKLVTLTVEGLPRPTLPGLCNVFESLLQEVDPQVFHHLNSLGCPAMQLAFPWINSAFVGYLPVEELLLLWDRLFGWDSLLVLPVFAVAIITFRRELLLHAGSVEDIDDVVDDFSHIRVGPLLQALLIEAR